MTSPLHVGQWSPQPAPEPVIRTHAPYMMTSSVYPRTAHAKVEKRVEGADPAAGVDSDSDETVMGDDLLERRRRWPEKRLRFAGADTNSGDMENVFIVGASRTPIGA